MLGKELCSREEACSHVKKLERRFRLLGALSEQWAFCLKFGRDDEELTNLGKSMDALQVVFVCLIKLKCFMQSLL